MNDIQERIAFAQSWNLAATMVAPLAKDVVQTLGEEAPNVLCKSIERWQLYFYDKLTNRPEVNRAAAAEKGQDDADHDAGLADTIQ